MKKAVGFLMAVVFMFVETGTLSAETRSYAIQLTVPTVVALQMGLASVQASGGTIAASSVSVSSNTWTKLSASATEMSFNPMVFNATYKYWASDHYFAVDVGGSSSLTTVVTYIEGTNQNWVTGGHGLGYKALATFVKVKGSGTNTTESVIAVHGKKRLIDLTGETVTPAQVSGGWLRVYLGIATGATGDPAGSEVFTNADQAGTYNGTIIFSATVS